MLQESRRDHFFSVCILGKSPERNREINLERTRERIAPRRRHMYRVLEEVSLYQYKLKTIVT